jgi:pimeloyl-ACP methyl ester carboxylesterase
MAADRPELVRKLVLVGTGPRGGEGMAKLEPEVGALFTRKYDQQDTMWLPIFFSPSERSQAAGRRYLDRIRVRTEDRDVPVREETITAHSAAAAEWGAPAEGRYDYLAKISQPALVVNGSNDIVIPTVNSYLLQQHLPNAELVLYPDSNHGSQFQFPNRFTRQVAAFLDCPTTPEVASADEMHRSVAEQNKAVVDAYYQAGVRGELRSFAEYLEEGNTRRAANGSRCDPDIL